jgi:hypothetical protein
MGVGILAIAVIPAQAGMQLDLGRQEKWIPAFAGMTACGAESG